MKYKTRDNLVASLRELADFIEDHGIEMPELDVSVRGYVSDYHPKTYRKSTGYPRKMMRNAALAMRKAQKIHDNGTFKLRREFGIIPVVVWTSREQVCKKIVVEKIQMPETVIPAYEREVAEWVCDDPILASEGQD